MRFGVMHCIASSLCFWLWTIIRETMDSLSPHEYAENDESQENDGEEDDHDDRFLGSMRFMFLNENSVALPLKAYSKTGAKELVTYLNHTLKLFTSTCDGDKGLRLIYQNYSPYLYPFTVEYSILVGKI